jgi:hypothetical protein
MYVSVYISDSILQFWTRYKQKTNSGALVRQRTIATERPPLAGEVPDSVLLLYMKQLRRSLESY